MTNNQMREAVISAYKSPSWTQKVYAMSDAQVVAIYLKLKKDGKI